MLDVGRESTSWVGEGGTLSIGRESIRLRAEETRAEYYDFVFVSVCVPLLQKCEEVLINVRLSYCSHHRARSRSRRLFETHALLFSLLLSQP